MKHSAMQLFVGLSAIAQAGLAVLALSGAVGASNSISTPSAAVGKVPEGLTAAEWKKMRVAIERDQYRPRPQGQGYYASNHA